MSKNTESDKSLIKRINGYEPKTSSRFLVVFPEDFNLPSFLVNSVTLPTFLNRKWEDLDISFVDTVEHSITNSLANLIERFNYTTDDKNEIIFDYTISSLNPIGEIVETWKIFVSEITYVNFGHMNYDSNYVKLCHMQVKPVKCKLVNNSKENPIYHLDDFNKVFNKVFNEAVEKMKKQRDNDPWVVYPNYTYIFPDIECDNYLHNQCSDCHGTGINKNGGCCFHHLSRPKCSPRC